MAYSFMCPCIDSGFDFGCFTRVLHVGEYLNIGNLDDGLMSNKEPH